MAVADKLAYDVFVPKGSKNAKSEVIIDCGSEVPLKQ